MENSLRNKRRRGLNALDVSRLGPGLYGDDHNGLYLFVARPTARNPKGSRSWIVRYASPITGKRREMGLGTANLTKGGLELAQAREKAADVRRAVRAGIDPIEAEREALAAEQQRQAAAAKAAVTFGDYSERVLDEIGREFKNVKHLEQWRMTLRYYAQPLKNMSLADISQDDIVEVFKQVPKAEAKRGGTRPLWAAVPETARRLRGRIETVLAHAKAEGYRAGENPAALTKDLALRLKRLSDRADPNKDAHFARLEYDKLPAFLPELRTHPGMAPRALEFLILTAARSGEVRGADWSEFDLTAPIPLWSIPAARMKAGRKHEVPLSRQAVELLVLTQPDAERRIGSVFPGERRGKPLSDMTLTAVLRRMGRKDITVHGFRSTFRDWAGDETEFAHETIEASLAHVIRDKTVAAYRRNSAIKKRAALMAAWADFCLSTNGSETVIRLAA